MAVAHNNELRCCEAIPLECEVRSMVIDDLNDLYNQATKERSHYYVGKVVRDSIDYIRKLETFIANNCDPANMTSMDANIWHGIHRRVNPENYQRCRE